MADFPVDKTNAVPEVTPIMAKHLNNLEGKVGKNNDPATTSLDYRIGMLDGQSTVLGAKDHDPMDGSHREGAWRIGTHAVQATGVDIDQVCAGAHLDATVTEANLTSLTNGSDIGSVLHTHGVTSVLKSLYDPIPPVLRYSDISNIHGLTFWYEEAQFRLWVIAHNQTAEPWDTVKGIPWGPGDPAPADPKQPYGAIKFSITGATVVSCTSITLGNALSPWKTPVDYGVSLGVVSWTTLAYPNTVMPGINPNNKASDCFVWSTTLDPAWQSVLGNNCFYVGYLAATAGDCFYIQLPPTTVKANTTCEVEMVFNSTASMANPIRDIRLGRAFLQGQFGYSGHKVKFGLDGVIYEY